MKGLHGCSSRGKHLELKLCVEEVRASVKALPDSGGGRQQWRQLPTQQDLSTGQDAHHSPVQIAPGRPGEKKAG